MRSRAVSFPAAALGLDTFRSAALLRPLPPAAQLGPLLVSFAAYCHDKIRVACAVFGVNGIKYGRS